MIDVMNDDYSCLYTSEGGRPMPRGEDQAAPAVAGFTPAKSQLHDIKTYIPNLFTYN